MTHITAGVEYALHSLLFLVSVDQSERRATIKELAEFQDISTDFIAKIFTRLKKADLVSSSEGVTGGFKLAKPPEEITVWDVIAAVDGERKIFDCRNIRSKCLLFKGRRPTAATGSICTIHGVMIEAEAKMRSALRSHSLSEIARSVDGYAGRGLGSAFDEWLCAK